MIDRRYVVLVLLLVAQTLVSAFGSSNEYLPKAPVLDSFPRNLPGWALVTDEPIPREVLAALRADATLSRYYSEDAYSTTAHLLVVWFQSQQGGRQPHSPKVCLPGSGWEPVEAGTTRIRDATVNRYVVANGHSRSVVLYWYQTPFRTVADEWAAKFWLVADSLRYHRTDTALVRVVAADDRTASRFADAAYPVLGALLKRN
jgi:EpsI family protein